MGAYSGFAAALEFFVTFSVFAFFTLLTTVILFIVSFTPLWTPYLYLSFIVSILLSGYINRQLLK